MRRAAKIDRNQPEIVKALRKAGASVQPLHSVGGGCPDLLVGFRNQNWLIEVKDGSLAPSGRKLTDAQRDWHPAWRGQVAVVLNADEALSLIVGNEASRKGGNPSGSEQKPEFGETGMPLNQHITGKAGEQ
ncbi:hypothetical protein [Paracoccus sp. (in: a-proteobacteria)]|uniref:hypothetical protein n=1 Tax=Paracoccus sp. TaxID=267 RepID=UPI003342DB17